MDGIKNISNRLELITHSKKEPPKEVSASVPMERLDLYEKSFEDTNIEANLIQKIENTGKKAGGITLGMLMDSMYTASGIPTMIHEYGHAAVVHAFFANAKTDIQIDAFDNLKNFLKHPTGENFGKILSGYDVNQDKAAGMTKIDPGDKFTPAGAITALLTGGRGVAAAIAAAGCVAEEIPTFIGFAAGYKMRKQSPLMGYALMSMATIHHINSSLYPFSAMIPSIAKTPGHDWVTFAKATGIPPIITAVAYASTLPALGYLMHRAEKKHEETMKNRWAIARLIQNGGISPQELLKSFNEYKDKENLEKAQDNLAALLDKPIAEFPDDTKKITKELKNAIRDLKKEYDKFSDYMVSQFTDRVKEELKKEPPPVKKTVSETISEMKAKMASAWKEDRVGTALSAGTISGTAGIALGISGATVASIAGAAGVASAISKVVVPAIPLVGTVGAASSIYNAVKTVKSDDADLIDKAAAVGVAVCSAVSAAGVLGMGAPFVILGIAGALGIQATKTVINAFKN